MTPKKNIKEIESKLKSQLNILEKVSSKSIDPDITAKYIALSDPEVWKLFISKLKNEDYVFNGIYCIDVPILEYRGVVLDFDCHPDIMCLVKPWFLVTVNFINRKVISIDDPYMPISNLRNSISRESPNIGFNSFSFAANTALDASSIDPEDISILIFSSGGSAASISIDSNNANDIGYTINVQKRSGNSQVDVINPIIVPSLTSPEHKTSYPLGDEISVIHRTNLIININPNPSQEDEKLSADVMIMQGGSTIFEYEAKPNADKKIHRRIFRLLVD